ncbi:3-dehydroquinate synthase [Kyrpidia spormannii]|uniref:3-dehydroquinate synthase n=1 Tax=Kyrpidia spormannii TaxID=2055160 RepID=A0A2K8N651_9BACL|nr:3-dehydroquinate synthase [Kyrpidia spormannii]ATY84841.1 3-dehydroquinate synthase [Kyrpidia spormannii]
MSLWDDVWDVVWVELGDRRYPIVVADGAMDQAGKWMREVGLSPGSVHLIVTDETVDRAGYARRVAAALTAEGVRVETAVVPAGEPTKSLEWASRLWEAALAAGLDRRSAIWAVGGGMVGDLAGFVAATYMRGIAFVQVPTTWLAHDAAVGGKVAINLPEAKNVVGAFHQPRLVLYDPTALDSLSARDVASGLAEVVKHACIRDAELFYELAERGKELLHLAGSDRGRLLARSCAIKARVVEEDEKESGVRAHLNFGHTLGHSLETLGDYRRYRHGEAVAVGMVFAALLSEEWLGAPPGTAERIACLLEEIGLPVRIPAEFTDDDLIGPMYKDKKMIGGHLTFVLLETLGRARAVTRIPEEAVRKVLDRHRRQFPPRG